MKTITEKRWIVIYNVHPGLPNDVRVYSILFNSREEAQSHLRKYTGEEIQIVEISIPRTMTDNEELRFEINAALAASNEQYPATYIRPLLFRAWQALYEIEKGSCDSHSKP